MWNNYWNNYYNYWVIEGITENQLKNDFGKRENRSAIALVMTVDMLKNKNHFNKFKCFIFIAIFTDRFYQTQ